MYGPSTEDIVERNLKAGRLTFSNDSHKAIGDSRLVFVAVGTPPEREDGSSELRYLLEAVETIRTSLTQDALASF